MKDIKVKETSNKTIKTINRVNLWSERIKDSVMCLNQKSKDSVSNDTSIVDYGSEQVSLISNRMKNESIHILKKSSVKLNNKVIKNSNKSIKTINRSIKDTSKAAKNPIKVSKKTFEQGRKLAIETAKQTTKTVKLLFKVTVSTIKSIIATLKSLVSIISAGGIVSIIIIVITALVSLIFTSCFGIFFSNEGSSISMSSVISETNVDLYNEIERQKALHTCDDYEIVYDSNNWREVIAIYSVKYSASESPETILYLNEDNISKIKKVFWDMNIITTKTIYEEKESETLSEGSYVTTLQPKNILYITINNKSKEELMSEYLFTEDQENQVNELLDQKYNLLWNNLFYGMSSSNDLVNIAIQEVGNIHGEKYWSWYGFKDRVSWCAIFVSWVANQTNVLNVTIPKFSLVGDGARWYKERGKWMHRGYIPKNGDLIFFDWEGDKKLNHVGIVEKAESDYIYVIEGNSNDQCKENKYAINDIRIAGFGIT